MFRGWVVYTHFNQGDEVLTYSGRDAGFDEKWQKWLRDGKPHSTKPMKHKYVKGYHRGLELYGQHASRLKEPAVVQSLKRHGLVVVEGMNDVIRLDTLGVAAVGLCSNRATDEQVAKIVQFANQVANNRVVLMPDCDEEGETGFKELLWRIAEYGISVRLAWSSQIQDGKFANRQPESITAEEWKTIAGRLR
ncbi:MAG: toprim domain-containing protein [Planctomycetes bacterium]|nr:toprim domain-containing protein [Planctomycetota bacterium]